MKLNRQIEDMLKGMGADLVGFADVDGLAPDGYKRAVAAAIALPPEIIVDIPQGPTREYVEVYMDINRRLDEMAEAVSDMLKKTGNRSLAQTQKSTPWDRERMSTPFPHKTAATRAGLGWIGKCALLVTPEFGSGIRITSILTDADFDTAEPVTRSHCGSCGKCVDICPGKAIRGELWYAGIERAKLVDIPKCDRAARDIAEKKLGYRTTMCGRCFAVCPYTQAYINRANTYSLK